MDGWINSSILFYFVNGRKQSKVLTLIRVEIEWPLEKNINKWDLWASTRRNYTLFAVFCLDIVLIYMRNIEHDEMC